MLHQDSATYPHQRREESSRALLEERLAHFRNEYADAMRETAMSFISIHPEFQRQGARLEPPRELVNTQLTPQMDRMQTEQDNMGVRLTQLSQEHEQHSNDMGASAVRLHEAQEDLEGMFRTLA